MSGITSEQIVQVARAAALDASDEWLSAAVADAVVAAVTPLIRQQAIEEAERAIRVKEPLLDLFKHEGGYDCCGCSTYETIFEDAIAAVRSLHPTADTPTETHGA